MEEFISELKIPKERIPILIGKKGEIKEQIEESTNTDLDINSKEGDVFIKGDDGLNIFTAKEIIRAIARGFSPESAFVLLKPNYSLEIMNIGEYIKSKKSLIRLRGRIIGSEGKSRRVIEKMTETSISVFGKTIAIIGEVPNVKTAKKAIDSLIAGSTHASVFKWLENKRRDLKRYAFETKDL
jgi:ribosomal RNA assembly protein